MRDELEQLRDANPVAPRAGERLSAPHADAFREAIAGDGFMARAGRGRGDGRPTRHVRLTLAAAAVALVAVPAMLLARDDTGEIVVRTPATDEQQPVDNDVDQPPPRTDEGDLFEPTISTTQESEAAAPGVDDADDARAPTTSATTTTAPTPPPTSTPTTAVSSTQPAPAGAPPATPTEPSSTSAPTETAAPTPASTTSTTTPAGTPTPTTTSPPLATTTRPDPATTSVNPGFDGPFDPATDLLMITFDFAHLDDGHAALAARELTTHFGLDPVVVAGTKAPESERFAHDHVSIMSTAWGSTWLDATGSRPDAIDQAVNRWLDTIDGGGEIWIAEGGVSDFTADVLDDVRQQRPGLATAGIVHVIHHSSGNVDATQASDLAVLEAHTDIVRIDDGNSLNDTADLNGPSDDFERIALDGPTASEWTAGFGYLPAGSLDFSDTVTLLHALGVGVDAIADAGDFATAIMS